jgi:hypothetical protein
MRADLRQDKSVLSCEKVSYGDSKKHGVQLPALRSPVDKAGRVSARPVSELQTAELGYRSGEVAHGQAPGEKGREETGIGYFGGCGHVLAPPILSPPISRRRSITSAHGASGCSRLCFSISSCLQSMSWIIFARDFRCGSVGRTGGKLLAGNAGGAGGFSDGLCG